MSNWSGTVRFRPRQVIKPRSVEEVSAQVRSVLAEGQSLRVMGAGHSFSSLIETSGDLISLDGLSGVRSVDTACGLATVRAGTRLSSLGPMLAAHGLAQENLGDIDSQSIAGAVSTGTHGTGIGLGTLSTQIRSLRLVNGQGELVNCSPTENPELLDATRVSLGALGILTELELQCLPLYCLECVSRAESLNSILESWVERVQANRGFEFFWFPYGETAVTKTTRLCADGQETSRIRCFVMESVLENSILTALGGLVNFLPSLAPRVGRSLASLARVAGGGVRRGPAHRVYATSRWARFNEMEYSLPIENMEPAIKELQQAFRCERFQTHFPIEVRFVRGDSIWLSPAYGRDSVFIAVHMQTGADPSRYFREAERIFLNLGGRPHWGKMHGLSASELSRLYSRWGDFLAIREKMDPAGVFLNAYLHRLLGVEAGARSEK